MITLASDFGSPYPAAMRGVILSRTDARVVDVAHDFPRQDVRAAAFWLREVLPWFPPAVHCAVVDPGVGTDRDVLVVRAGGHALVGPDNGLLLPAARALATRQGESAGGGASDQDGSDDPAVEVFVAEVEDPASNTFHGRDVFAPLAARVYEAGVDALADLATLSPAGAHEDRTFPVPDVAGDAARGEVLVVDGFGNAVTNLPGDLLADRWGEAARVNGERVPVARSYAAVPAGERLLTVGSHGNVELAVNRGRGEAAFGVGVGATVTLEVS